MIKTCKLAALALAAVLSFGGAAGAGETKKEPAAPKQATLADGRIEEYIGTDRVAGYGIGDPIKVKLIFDLMSDSQYRAQHNQAPVRVTPAPALAPAAADPKAPAQSEAAGVEKVLMPKMLEWPMIEVEGLRMAVDTGKVTEQPSDVEVYRGATVETFPLSDGRRRIVVTMILTQYVTTQKEADGKTPKTQADVALDFSWAVASTPDGQPDWHAATSPELTFGIHLTADPNQTVPIEGDLSAKTSPHAAATPWLLGGSWIFLIPALAAVVLALVGRFNRRREATANEKTWAAIAAVCARASGDGEFRVEHYQHIFHILREHLHFYGITTTQALERVLQSADIDHEAGAYVFNQETVLFDSEKRLALAERTELLKQIAVLVPISAAQLDKVVALSEAIQDQERTSL
jgi:hypothetical protein